MKKIYVMVVVLTLFVCKATFAQVDSSKFNQSQKTIEKKEKKIERMNREVERKQDKVEREDRKLNREKKKAEREERKMRKQQEKLDKQKADSLKVPGVSINRPSAISHQLVSIRISSK